MLHDRLRHNDSRKRKSKSPDRKKEPKSSSRSPEKDKPDKEKEASASPAKSPAKSPVKEKTKPRWPIHLFVVAFVQVNFVQNLHSFETSFVMEYTVHGSKNKNDSNFKLTWERVC